jgi:IS5 family transposase
MREFVGIDLAREPVPDETTIRKFRHLMEKRSLGDQPFRLVSECLQESGLKLSLGTILDATIIPAPSSTKNKQKQRDPEHVLVAAPLTPMARYTALLWTRPSSQILTRTASK